jgi:hypothetical protein
MLLALWSPPIEAGELISGEPCTGMVVRAGDFSGKGIALEVGGDCAVGWPAYPYPDCPGY